MIPLKNNAPTTMIVRADGLAKEEVTGKSSFDKTASSFPCCSFRRLQRGPTFLFHFTHAGTK